MSDDEKLPPLFGWEWNERDEFPEELRDVMATITCLSPGISRPIQVGSGFIIQSRGNRGLVLTAAHVITQGVRAFQNPARARASRTIPPEFLPVEEVSAATPALRVLIQKGSHVEICRVASVLWDEPADLAILAVTTQDAEPTDLIDRHLKLAGADPVVGDIILTAGFAEFETQSEAGSHWKGSLSRRPVLRAGRVTNLHPEGTIWIRSRCVEATMPTFSGMSGGPAFFYSPGSEPTVFGLLSQSTGISSNPTEHDPDAFDRSKATRPSTFSLIARTIEGPLSDGSQVAKLKFTITGKAINDQIDPRLFNDDWIWSPE